MAGPATRVFVAAATPLSRAGLRALLEGEDDVVVVGEAAGVSGLEGDLFGVDAIVVAEEGLLEETASALASASADAVSDEKGRALVLLSDDEGAAQKLLSLAPPHGWGVVSPDAPPDELSATVVGAARGLAVLPKELAERLLRETAPGETAGAPVEPPPESLTARELEVLSLMSRGLSNKMISRDLGISEHTVKFHVSGVFAKLSAGSRTEAVNLGARLGLISL